MYECPTDNKYKEFFDAANIVCSKCEYMREMRTYCEYCPVNKMIDDRYKEIMRDSLKDKENLVKIKDMIDEIFKNEPSDSELGNDDDFISIYDNLHDLYNSLEDAGF